MVQITAARSHSVQCNGAAQHKRKNATQYNQFRPPKGDQAHGFIAFLPGSLLYRSAPVQVISSPPGEHVTSVLGWGLIDGLGPDLWGNFGLELGGQLRFNVHRQEQEA